MPKDKTTKKVKETSPKVKETSVRVKKKPRGGNSPVIGMNGYNLEPGDNTRITMMNLELFNLPNIDMKDVDQVAQRLTDFFTIFGKYDMKPTVAGMASVLNGHNRQWLWSLTHGQPYGGMDISNSVPPQVLNLIKKAYQFMENSWESYMNSGKLNPVTGIFLAKNNFGYKDQTDVVVTPTMKTDNDFSAEEIRQRYIDSSES